MLQCGIMEEYFDGTVGTVYKTGIVEEGGYFPLFNWCVVVVVGLVVAVVEDVIAGVLMERTVVAIVVAVWWWFLLVA